MARMKGLQKTKRYSEELKNKAVQLASHPDILAKDVAEDLGSFVMQSACPPRDGFTLFHEN